MFERLLKKASDSAKIINRILSILQDQSIIKKR